MVKLKFVMQVTAFVSAVVFAQLSLAQEFVWAPEFPVGSKIPQIEAQDSSGELQTFESLVGEKGLLLMLSRSFDW